MGKHFFSPTDPKVLQYTHHAVQSCVTLSASNLHKLFSFKQAWNSIWINYEHLWNVLDPNPTNYKPNWWFPGTGHSSWLVTWPQKSTSGRHAFSNAETGMEKYLNNITERKIVILY